jgi:hypothetical protein
MTHLEKLRQRVLKATVMELAPKNKQEIWDILSSRTKITNEGQIVVLDGAGITVSDLAFDTWALNLPKVRPDCFETVQPTAVETITNPFVKGKDFSVSAQMILFRTNPSEATRLEAEAKKKN